MQTETKRDKFQRIAENRTNHVLDKIRVLAKCANPHAYEYNDRDVNEIFSAIESELRRAKALFRTNEVKFEFSRPAGKRVGRSASKGGS